MNVNLKKIALIIVTFFLAHVALSAALKASSQPSMTAQNKVEKVAEKQDLSDK
jgi:hypothetical protein